MDYKGLRTLAPDRALDAVHMAMGVSLPSKVARLRRAEAMLLADWPFTVIAQKCLLDYEELIPLLRRIESTHPP